MFCVIHGHGGNIWYLAQRLGCLPSDIADLSSNVNPLGPPHNLLDFLKNNIDSVLALPEVDARKIVAAFSKRYRIQSNGVLAGNGTTQFIYAIPRALNSEKALILAPAYSDYADACRMHSVSYHYFFSDESCNFMPDTERIHQIVPDYDTVFICNPNNPTGVLISPDEIEQLCLRHPEIRFIVDESYLPFVPDYEQFSMVQRGLPNVIVLNSMSKIFRIPGLRIGFLIASEEMISGFIPLMLPWSVNSLAQAAVMHLMEDFVNTDRFIEFTAGYLASERDRMIHRFIGSDDLKLFPSVTSFILGKLSRHTGADLCEYLAQKKILIRDCSNFEGLSDTFVRISLKTEDINTMIAREIGGFFSQPKNIKSFEITR